MTSEPHAVEVQLLTEVMASLSCDESTMAFVARKGWRIRGVRLDGEYPSTRLLVEYLDSQGQANSDISAIWGEVPGQEGIHKIVTSGIVVANLIEP